MLYKLHFAMLSWLKTCYPSFTTSYLHRSYTLILSILTSSCLAFSAPSSNVHLQKLTDGIQVTLERGDTLESVRIQVISDKILHISAVPDRDFPDFQSLITAMDSTVKTRWSVKQTAQEIRLSTSSLQAVLSIQTGAIQFFDAHHHLISEEKRTGGRSFTPITVDQTSGYTIRQVFESPDDEALYGLGQHQAGDMNYKGKNEILFQYNTKVSIPFIVSNKNYGILWDNYSLTKFGDIRDYDQLSAVRLFDKTGTEGGLTASYYRNGTQLFTERQEKEIDYENLTTTRNILRGFPLNNSKIVWEGDMAGYTIGTHRFQVYYAGYIKVYLDQELIMDKWRTAWNPSIERFSVDFNSLTDKHHIRIEWQPDGGTSYLGVKLLTPNPVEDQQRISWYSEMGEQIDYYFIAGKSMDDVISGYRTITGKSPIMPKWAMGFWQSRERYKTQDELLSTLQTFRTQQIPIDNIVLDWSYWPENAWGSHEFDTTRFPDATAMCKAVHDLHAHIMISVWPKFYTTTEHFKAFDAKGWMYRQAVDDHIKDWIGRGYEGSFYDAYDKNARKLFWDQMNEHLVPKGFDAWWMDASEPDILSNADIDYRKALMNPTALGPSTQYFNAYALVNAQAIYEGQRQALPDQRVFLLTRCGFAGSQRYAAAIWSGDIGTRWEDMKAQITAGMNFSMAGLPYWTMDIGGFCVENRYTRSKAGSEDEKEWQELNTRWYQFGAFCPLFRSHGQYPYREVFHIAPEGHPAYRSIVYYQQLRYRLMPYLYTLSGNTYHRDGTLMRGLPFDFGTDTEVLNITDQYMLGPQIMVCPVYHYGALTRSVYFPQERTWFNAYSGQAIDGGKRLEVEAPYERMPVFIPSGSILPMGPIMQYTDEKPDAPITLWVYTGRDAQFDLYEDDGVSYQYEEGAFSYIPITYDERKGTLTLHARQGSFPGMSSSRTFEVIWVDENHPAGWDTTSQVSVQTLFYQGKEIKVKR